MAKFGAILAQGIIDAGGRNCTVSLQSRTGHTNLQAVVGMLVFTQYWYWFPLAHCLSLAFTPTCLIGLNSDLKMPKMEFKSSARPSLYAYPAPVEEKKREEKEKVTTAVLSIAARQKRREGDKKKDDNKMDVDEEVTTKESGDGASTSTASSSTTTKDTKESKVVVAKDEKSKTDKKPIKEDSAEEASTSATKERKEPEPLFEILQNPPRVLRQQLKVLSMPENPPFTPLKEITIGGIIMMQHTSKDDQELVEPVAAYGPKNEEEKEPEAPEAFEFIED